MPDTTVPRGYPYPIYTDTPMDFPTAIEDLAVAVDSDMTVNAIRIPAARDRPSVRMTSSAGQSITQNTNTTASFTTGSITYDNGSMANLASSRLELTEQGVYMICARVTMTGLGSGSSYGLRASILSSAGLIPTVAIQSRTAHHTQDAALSLAGLHYKAAAGTDFITLQLNHSATAARTLTFRNLCATKMSNIAGGS